jgi:hypothetical protein
MGAGDTKKFVIQVEFSQYRTPIVHYGRIHLLVRYQFS